MKMTFTCEHYDWDDFTGKQKDPISKVVFETKNVELTEILTDFEQFLRGAGFHFDGNLDIVEDERWNPIEESCDNCVCESAGSPGWNSVVDSLMNPPSFRAADLTGKNS